MLLKFKNVSGAHPGFPVGGSADPLGGPTYDFVKNSQKLHEIEKILGRGGGRAPRAPPLDPPLRVVCHLKSSERSTHLFMPC